MTRNNILSKMELYLIDVKKYNVQVLIRITMMHAFQINKDFK